MRILLVDDQEALRQLLVDVLRGDGREITAVASGEEAIALMAEWPFDVVVSDLGLGVGIDGWELAAQVRARWAGVRFLLATGSAPLIDPALARSRGVEAVLNKPFRIADLEAAVTAPL